MRTQIVSKRYALGVVKAISSDKEFKKINQDIVDFLDLIEKNKDFREFIFSPFYSSPQKRDILFRMLEKSAYSEKSKRFLLLLVEKNRLLLLKEIKELIESLWNEQKNIHTFEVTSVYPLTEEQKRNLFKKLEKIVKGKVIIKFKKDSSLIGGLIIRKGDILYDGSIKGNLLKLKDKILGEE